MTTPPLDSPSSQSGASGGVASSIHKIKAKAARLAFHSRSSCPLSLLVLERMNSISCGSPAMCYACQPRLTALQMPKVHTRPEPTGPEYFTFDPLPEVEMSPAHKKGSKANSHRLKKRSRRVLYPPVGKRYYPTEEPNYAKRLLFILLAIVLFQIYNAEEELPPTLLPLSAEENISSCSMELRESHGEPLHLQEPVFTAPSMGSIEEANATGWHWGEDETSESTVDITQFLEQSPAAF